MLPFRVCCVLSFTLNVTLQGMDDEWPVSSDQVRDSLHKLVVAVDPPTAVTR